MPEAPPRLTPADLRRPAWVAAHVGVVLLAVAFALLGRWQWDVGHKVAPLTTADLTAWRTPKPVAAVITPAGLDGTQVGQAVAVTGSYDGAHQLLVPGRTLDAVTGYYVLTPLVTAPHEAIVVNRGFIPATHVTKSPTGTPEIPPAPPGERTVTGWAAEPESTTGEVNNNGIAQQQQTGAVTAANEIQFISPAALVNQWPYHLPDAYVTATDPASRTAALAAIPAPLPPHGTTWDLLNVCYAFQWWLFIGILGSWYTIHLSRELRPQPLGEDDGDGDDDGDDDEDEELEDTAEPGLAPR